MVQLGVDAVPYFFLAYAHTPERPWVVRLYRDICTEVFERTTLPAAAKVGFMDDGIPLGGDWKDEVARALATCRVFVPLYSPRYFTRQECGIEWHAFAQRILDHQARRSEMPSVIVPALWTPVDVDDIPEVAQSIQMNHGDLGAEYAREGFYTLIKNSLYEHAYLKAVQQLAKHIIRAAESNLRPCQVRDFGTRRNAFEQPDRTAPADRRLILVTAAPTVNQLPAGRSAEFYGPTSNDWNPFHPGSQQSIVEYAAAVARLNSYEPTLMSFDEGFELFADRDPGAGLGLLLIDAWATVDEKVSRRLRTLDSLDLGWVGTMVPWNLRDSQTQNNADELRRNLRAALPRRLGEARPFAPTNSARILTLEQFRTRLPEVVEGALFRYLNHVEAHPPAGAVPPRPRLTVPGERGSPGLEKPYPGVPDDD